MTLTVLDTNVISELIQLQPNANVNAFPQSIEAPLVSAIVFHELAYGCERLRDGRKRMTLELFLEGAKAMYEGHIVEVDLHLAELAGRLRARASRSGWVLAEFDSLIAATTILKRAQLATRNFGDFERLGISIVNPWDG